MIKIFHSNINYATSYNKDQKKYGILIPIQEQSSEQ